jgi:hypothetical protein
LHQLVMRNRRETDRRHPPRPPTADPAKPHR